MWIKVLGSGLFKSGSQSHYSNVCTTVSKKKSSSTRGACALYNSYEAVMFLYSFFVCFFLSLLHYTKFIV